MCDSRWFNDGREEFIRGDVRTQIGLRNLRRDTLDIECGVQDMQRGFRINERNNFRNQRVCPCRVANCPLNKGCGCSDTCHLGGCNGGGIGGGPGDFCGYVPGIGWVCDGDGRMGFRNNRFDFC